MAQKNYVDKTGLSNFLTKLREAFAAKGHKHTTADITDYKVDSSLSSTSTNPVQNKVINTKLNSVETAVNKKTQVQFVKWESGD